MIRLIRLPHGRARRLTALLALPVAAATALTACDSSPGSPGSSATPAGGPISVIYAQENLSFGISLLGWRKFKSQGNAVTVSNAASPSLSLEDTAVGKADLAETNPIAALSAIAAGENIVIVATLTNAADFVLASPTSITSVGQLSGKTIAVNSTASLSNAVVQNLIDKGQVRSPTVVDINGGSNRDAALTSGRVSAISVFIADGIQVSQTGTNRFHILKSFAGYPVPDQILVANKTWAQSHQPELASAFKTLSQTAAAFNAKPVSYVPQLQEIFPSDTKRLITAWAQTAAKLKIAPVDLGGTSQSQLATWIKALKPTKLIPATVPADGAGYAMFGPLGTALGSS